MIRLLPDLMTGTEHLWAKWAVCPHRLHLAGFAIVDSFQERRDVGLSLGGPRLEELATAAEMLGVRLLCGAFLAEMRAVGASHGWRRRRFTWH